MTTLPFSARLARSLATFVRPTRRRAPAARIARLEAHMLKDIGLGGLDVDAMRRMW